MMDEEVTEERVEPEDAPEEECKSTSSLFDEVKDMLQVSLLTYLFSDLRTIAKEGKLVGEPEALETITNLPIQAKDIFKLIDIYNKNVDTLKPSDKYEAAFGWALRDVYEQHKDTAEQNQDEIVVYDDENPELECVYLIIVSRLEKTVLVSFRGSVTLTDFIKDTQIAMRDIPVQGSFQGVTTRSEMVGIHHGFQDYLFGQQTSPSAQQPGKARKQPRRQAMQNKCETIINHVAALLDENPGYRLATTGHSLGGALATAFAFVAAQSQDPRIPKPVICISVASPKVGNLAFRLATEDLERQGKLRLLRVANQGDMVTLAPQFSFNCFTQSCLKANFRHVGMKLLLRPRWWGGYKISYPRAPKHNVCYFCLDQLSRTLKHCFWAILFLPLLCICSCLAASNFLNNHGLHEYLARLNENKDELKELSLEGLYDEYLPVADNENNAKEDSDIEAASGGS